jgi:hypothetical protein
MHTSSVLQSSDFHYVHLGTEGIVAGDASSFWSDYQASDRVGVVSPHLEDGIVHTGYALLALTTLFYDGLRSSQADFFDYPPHFALIGVTEDGIQTYGASLPREAAPLEATWGNLDVWPASQWLYARPKAAEMLQKVFDFQINCVFWPLDLVPGADEARLPAYLRRMLRTRLKRVYYYHAADANRAIRVTQPVEDLVQESLVRLQRATGMVAGSVRPRQAEQSADNGRMYREAYRQVPVDEFLERMGVCFERRG